MTNMEMTGRISLYASQLVSGVYLWVESCFQNDMLSWLMDEARGERGSVEALTESILALNFVAIHTSSMVR